MGEAKPLTAFQQTYHWRNKNCGSWSHQWVKDNLPGLKVKDGAANAEVAEISSVSGDCDLGQRKGKLLTIYDLDIEAKWSGVDAEGNEVTGKLHIPEFSHEVVDGLSEYNFIIELSSASNPSSDALLKLVRAQLPPLLRAKFDTFRPTLLEAHGIFVDAPASASASGSSTPARYAPAPPGEVRAAPPPLPAQSASTSTSTASPPTSSTTSSSAPKPIANQKSVEVSAQLQISAQDLWQVLTDTSRIPMWTRSPAKLDLKPGAPYELFGGNVHGQVKEVEQPTKLVQSWQTRNGSWPADHFGTLTTQLQQGSDSTTLTLTLEGVPSGQEGDLERALNNFYIQGLKQMGLVLSSSSRIYSSPLARSVRKPSRRKVKKGQSRAILGGMSTGQMLGVGAVLGMSAVLVGMVVHSVSRAGQS